MVISTVT